MDGLDPFYVRMLRVGFLVLRQAVDARDEPWVQAELELLHNVPSLIGESNLLRHRYFWAQERSAYVQWVSEAGRGYQRPRMRTYYEPIWREMEPVLAGMMGEAP